ncbi:hypothetical protein [Escherichia coli]|uniref:hypothetical protein n=1 Tax=Escherichia coli TaxID=562 RepID=UPI00207BB845|nr:hypothetical protein [Escherichia coli]
MTLVNDTGFDPVFSGSIAESWRQQPCTPSYCCDWEAATMLRAFPLAKKGEGRARLPSLYASFGKLGGKRKLTAVCSHQTRIGNLDAHLI